MKQILKSRVTMSLPMPLHLDQAIRDAAKAARQPLAWWVQDVLTEKLGLPPIDDRSNRRARRQWVEVKEHADQATVPA